MDTNTRSCYFQYKCSGTRWYFVSFAGKMSGNTYKEHKYFENTHNTK